MEQTSRALLPQSPYKKFTLKHYHIKYGGVVVGFFLMIAAIKVFINYATIQTSIIQVVQETASIGRHQQYLSLQAYVYRLPEATQFISHDNGILLPGERVFIQIHTPTTGQQVGEKQIGEQIGGNSISEIHDSPFKSWIRYFAKKLSH